MPTRRVFASTTPASGGRLIAHSPELELSSASMTPSLDHPSEHGGRPLRSTRTKKHSMTAGFVDSSTLKIDSEDEGDSDSDDVDDLPPRKKIRLQGPVTKAASVNPSVHKQPSLYPASGHIDSAFSSGSESESGLEPEPEPQPKPWELKYYPETFTAVEKFNKILGPKPPDTDDLDAANQGLAEIKNPSRNTATVARPRKRIVKLKLPPGSVDKNACYIASKAGFMHLPGELRNQVYMLALKSDQQIDFKARKGFPHSSSLLRVNKTVYNEARNILYGANRFVFDQSTNKTGEYFEQDWNEINYIHVRKFLSTIGPENTSFLKNVGLCFEDATPSGHPNKDIDERRFENNKDLYWILKHLGRYGEIEKLKLGFSGRRTFHMNKSEATFLYALGDIKTDELSFGHPTAEGDDSCRWHRLHYGKLSSSLEAMLRRVMVRPVPLKKMDPRLEF